MGCIKVDNFIEMHDKPQTFLTVADKMSVHSLVLYGVSIRVRSFEFTRVIDDYILTYGSVFCVKLLGYCYLFLYFFYAYRNVGCS